jgi:hypothetical protein
LAVVILLSALPAPDRGFAEEPGSVLENCQIVAYYGHPATRQMGILGEYSVEDLVHREGGLSYARPNLRTLAAEYDAANGEKCAIPAFYIVFGTVWPGGEIGVIGEERLMPYIEVAEREGMVVILDHQLGRYSVTDAVAKTLPYLRYQSVHLAIDPEWHTARPALEVGSVTGHEVNEAQALIQQYMEEHQISGKKFLIVHQFRAGMIRDREVIRTDFSRVDLVHVADGFGSPAVKRAQYDRNAQAEHLPLKGFKLFFQVPFRRWGYDRPLLAPQDVLALEPSPAIIIYQ